jgi:hypothetical protein
MSSTAGPYILNWPYGPLIVEQPRTWIGTYPGDPTPINPVVVTVKTTILPMWERVEAMRPEEV